MPVAMIVFFALLMAVAPYPTQAVAGTPVSHADTTKVGVLLVNHGSRSVTWRQSLLQLEAHVAPTILNGHVVHSAVSYTHLTLPTN